MAKKSTKNYLVCYDVCDPRRLYQVNKTLKNYGFSLQYSVFLVQMNKENLRSLVIELDNIIKDSEDDIRLYPLPHTMDLTLMGKQQIPQDIYFSSFPLLKTQTQTI